MESSFRISASICMISILISLIYNSSPRRDPESSVHVFRPSQKIIWWLCYLWQNLGKLAEKWPKKGGNRRSVLHLLGPKRVFQNNKYVIQYSTVVDEAIALRILPFLDVVSILQLFGSLLPKRYCKSVQRSEVPRIDSFSDSCSWPHCTGYCSTRTDSSHCRHSPQWNLIQWWFLSNYTWL